MANQKPIVHIDFMLLGAPKGVDEYLTAHPEVRQMFRDGTKHSKKLQQMKDAPLQDRLQYVKEVCDAFELLYGDDTQAQSTIVILKQNDYSEAMLDKYVIDAYLAEDNWQ